MCLNATQLEIFFYRSSTNPLAATSAHSGKTVLHDDRRRRFLHELLRSLNNNVSETARNRVRLSALLSIVAAFTTIKITIRLLLTFAFRKEDLVCGGLC
jgi:hypothetical protein